MYKNTAGQTITLLVIDTVTNKPKTGDSANLTFYYKADAGSGTALSASPTEDSSTNAKGLYTATLLQAETNGDKILYSGKSSTSDVEVVPLSVYTDPPNKTLLNIDGSGKVLLQATQSGVTIPTVTTLTNLPTAPANWLNGDAVASTAVAKIVGPSANDYIGQDVMELITYSQSITAKLPTLVGGRVDVSVGAYQSGLAPLSESGVRSAVGLASANLDTQLSTIDSSLGVCENAASQLLGVEGDVPEVIRASIGLDAPTLTNDLKFISDSCAVVIRSPSDTSAISFMYPAPSLSLNGQVSINDGEPQAVVGAVTFLRDEGDQYFYSLAYNASDRPSSEGTARYTFSNSGNHVHVMLRVEQVSLSASGIRSAVGLASANLDTQLTAIDDFLDTEIAAIKAKTDNLPATPASTSDIPSAATVASTVWSNLTRTLSSGANIVLAKGTGITGLNDLDAAGIRSAVGLSSANVDTQLSAIASYIDTEIAAIKAKTDALPSDPADASDIAASFSSLASTLATIATYIDTEVAAIKAKTDNLPTDPADQSLVEAAITAATSTLASQSSVNIIDDFLDTEIAAIKAKTDNLPATPASSTDIPSAATVASIVWANATRTLSAGTNIVLAKGTGVTGFNDLDAAGVRSAVGLASANLDTQLVAIDDFLDTEVTAIKAKTDNLPAAPAAVSNIPTVVQIRQEMDSNSVKLSEIKSLAILGSGDQSSADFSNDYYDAVADAVLSRNVSNVEDGLAQHTLGGAILGQLEWSIDGSGNLTVYKTDGTTELYTKVVNSAVSDGNVITGLE